MFPPSLLMPFGIARKVMTRLVQDRATHPKEPGPFTTPLRPAAKGAHFGEHAAILATFEETARLGHVPADALIGRLYACHCDRLATDRQRLAGLEQELAGHLLCLDARFPAPVPPAPEKPEPARRRSFGRISRDLHRSGPGSQQ